MCVFFDGCGFFLSTSVQCCFSSCHTIAFPADMDFVKLVSFQLRLPVILRCAGEKLQAFFSFLFFLLCHDEKEKKVQYLNPHSLSHVQASICMSRSHVIIPFLLWLLPQSCSTAPGVSLIPTTLHNLQHTELYGSHLTSVIWRQNILFISVAKTASRCCFYDTYSECQTGWEILTRMGDYVTKCKNMGVQYDVLIAACFNQTKM